MHAVAWGGAIFNRGRHRVVDFREIDISISNLFGKIFDFDTPSRARLRRPPQPAKVRFFCGRIKILNFTFLFFSRGICIFVKR